MSKLKKFFKKAKEGVIWMLLTDMIVRLLLNKKTRLLFGLGAMGLGIGLGIGGIVTYEKEEPDHETIL